MNVIVDNLLVNYNLSGKGKLVVLLHGWGDSAQGLSGLQNALSEDYRVLSLDLPGFGSTQAPSSVWDLDDYSRFVSEFIKKLRLSQELYGLVGHSNGGAVAIKAVSAGHVKPKKLVLLAASGIREGRGGFKRLAYKVIAKVGKVLTLPFPERYRQNLRKRLYGTIGSDMMVAPQLQETFKRTVRQDVQAEASEIKVPTLLIYAAEDKAVPLSDGHRYNSLIKNSRLEIIEDAGHFVHLDQSGKVTSLIKEFLS